MSNKKIIIKKHTRNNTPKYAFGLENALGLSGMAMPMLGKSAEESAAGGFLSGAAGGASMGAALGPWGAAAGGVIGGVTGIFSAGKKRRARQRLEKKQAEDKQRVIDVRAFQNQMAMNNEEAIDFEMSNPIIPTFKNGVEGYNGKAFVNNKEMIQYPNGKSKSVIDNSGKVDNVLTNLPAGSSVFSDDLKTKDGKTFAEKAKQLESIRNKGYKNRDPFALQSQELNNAYVDSELEKLKQEQAMARNTNNGKTIPKYKLGTEGKRRLPGSANPQGDWQSFQYPNVFDTGLGLGYVAPEVEVSAIAPSKSPGLLSRDANLANNQFGAISAGINSVRSNMNTPKPTQGRPAGSADPQGRWEDFQYPNVFPTYDFGNTTQAVQPTMGPEAIQNVITEQQNIVPVEQPVPATKSKRSVSYSKSSKVAPIAPVTGDRNFAPIERTQFAPMVTPKMNASVSVPKSDNVTEDVKALMGNPSKPRKEAPNFNFSKGLNSAAEVLTDYLSLSPYRYNVSEGNKDYDIVTPQSNVYEPTINNKLRARRISMTPIMERAQKNRSIGRYNAQNMTGSGQNMAYNLAANAMYDRTQIDALQQAQHMNNQYVSEYAQVMAGLGAQQAQYNTYAEDMTARNKATRDAYRSTAASQLGQFAQNKMQMINKNNKNKGLLEALKPLLKEGYDQATLNRILGNS